MKIDHIALFCNDLEAMRRFFMDYFEAKPNELYHNRKTGLQTYILSFPDGDTRLEIMHRTDASKQIGDEYLHLGYIHASFSVGSKEQVDKLTLRLMKAGYQVHSNPRTTGDGYYESCVEGPENVLIEITV